MSSTEIHACYLAVSDSTNLKTLKDLLEERHIRPIASTELPTIDTTFLEGIVDAISSTDLVIALFEPEHDHTRIYIELGVAIAKKLRILIIASPEIKLPLDIAEIPSIRVSATNQEAITFALDQVLTAPRPRKYQLPSQTELSQKSQPIENLADEILEKLETSGDHITEVEVIHLLALALRTGGISTFAEAPLSSIGNTALPSQAFSRADLVVWSDEFDAWIGTPIIIEVKRKLRTKSDWINTVEQVSRYLQISQVRSALILYVDTTPRLQGLASTLPPNIYFMGVHQLIDDLRTRSFARIMQDLRNRRVHGIEMA